MGKYAFRLISEDLFDLHEDGHFLLRFRRSAFREDLERFAERYSRSSNWIGAVLRLFHRAYPDTRPHPERLHRLTDLEKESLFADCFRSRGFSVFKPLPFTDDDMVSFLNSRGFLVLDTKGQVTHTSNNLTFSMN